MINGNLKNVFCFLVVVLSLAGTSATATTNSGNATPASIKSSQAMPILHKIETYTFLAPYSCNGSYEKSALFLSDFSKGRNAPDLLFNGACGSTMYIQASTAGDDFSVISDLGNVTLESVSASKAFNYDRVVGRENTFKESMPVAIGHSFVVLITKSEIRALYVLHVDDISTNGKMTISYAVKSYSVQATQAQSPGFDWELGNQ